MENTNDNSAVCPECGAEVGADDDFCPDCGEIFKENSVCQRHPTTPAAGVCVVCSLPFCSECGGRMQGRFLCYQHDSLEIFEGMARVYGSGDAAQVDFAKSALETAGLHPFVFTRKASPISLGAPEYTLFNPSGDYDGHFVNEFKLMVPCQEVQAAEEKLRELSFIE
jgi:hypothetical protein